MRDLPKLDHETKNQKISKEITINANKLQNSILIYSYSMFLFSLNDLISLFNYLNNCTQL